MEEARVEEHEQIARHTGPDKYVVVVKPHAPVVGEASFLGQAGGDEYAGHAVQVRPLKTVHDRPVRLLLRRHFRKPSLHFLLSVAGLLQRGGVLGLGAEGYVVVRLTIWQRKQSKNVEQKGGGAFQVDDRRLFRKHETESQKY